jgi:hypothetical protein
MKRFSLILFILFVAVGSSNAQLFHRNASRKVEKGLFGKTVGNKKEVKVKEPKSVLKAKKKQADTKRKNDKAWAATVRKSRKRTVDIQTPEVQARMKQDEKNIASRDKSKKKKFHLSTKKAERKYK